jgi:hypothetical protein
VSKCWKQEKSNWKCLGSSSQESAQFGSIGLSGGAPDSVRCARMARAKWLLSGLRRRCTAIIHRTVRWCTGLSGGPFTGELVALGNSSATYGYNSPDCPVCTGLSGAPTALSLPTVDCAIYGKESGTGQCPVCTGLSGAPTTLSLPTVDCAIYGKESGTGQCPVCTGLSGAPVDRRQDQPS